MSLQAPDSIFCHYLHCDSAYKFNRSSSSRHAFNRIMVDPVVLPCAHNMCHGCVQDALASAHCPICNIFLEQEDLRIDPSMDQVCAFFIENRHFLTLLALKQASAGAFAAFKKQSKKVPDLPLQWDAVENNSPSADIVFSSVNMKKSPRPTSSPSALAPPVASPSAPSRGSGNSPTSSLGRSAGARRSPALHPESAFAPTNSKLHEWAMKSPVPASTSPPSSSASVASIAADILPRLTAISAVASPRSNTNTPRSADLLPPPVAAPISLSTNSSQSSLVDLPADQEGIDTFDEDDDVMSELHQFSQPTRPRSRSRSLDGSLFQLSTHRTFLENRRGGIETSMDSLPYTPRKDSSGSNSGRESPNNLAKTTKDKIKQLLTAPIRMHKRRNSHQEGSQPGSLNSSPSSSFIKEVPAEDSQVLLHNIGVEMGLDDDWGTKSTAPDTEWVGQEAYEVAKSLVRAADGWHVEANQSDQAMHIELEDKDTTNCFYQEFLASYPHAIFVGGDANNPIFLAAEKSVEYHPFPFKVLIYSKSGSKRTWLFDTLNVRLVMRLLKLDMFNMKQVPEAKFAYVGSEIIRWETMSQVKKFKFGAIFCKRGQNTEEEMFGNHIGSEAFESFLDLLSVKVKLRGFDKYAGGLNTKNDEDGEYSRYTRFHQFEVMFHVSTYLSGSQSDSQQILKKRHIGNDVVVLVFLEDGKIEPGFLKTQFNHVYVIVKQVKHALGVKYQISTTAKHGVHPFGPYPLDFVDEKDLKEFLLTKLINGERAAIKAPSFHDRITKARTQFLASLLDSAA